MSYKKRYEIGDIVDVKFSRSTVEDCNLTMGKKPGIDYEDDGGDFITLKAFGSVMDTFGVVSRIKTEWVRSKELDVHNKYCNFNKKYNRERRLKNLLN
ncbi:MAG: hypothetical protein SLAVMIC_00870 [uncultured marine phage]|uniref:Uncharacterized protein n=1 Tax=uncultured marine phage TaxID=707152 RepID=A0A8D9FSH7_9VIRU|nr:MAG: hypothetical protein SLAVMIC_00870 [uncultured marine phage]